MSEKKKKKKKSMGGEDEAETIVKTGTVRQLKQKAFSHKNVVSAMVFDGDS